MSQCTLRAGPKPGKWRGLWKDITDVITPRGGRASRDVGSYWRLEKIYTTRSIHIHMSIGSSAVFIIMKNEAPSQKASDSHLNIEFSLSLQRSERQGRATQLKYFSTVVKHVQTVW